MKPPKHFYKVGVTLTAGSRIGYSQIINIDEDGLYEILTDFGNIITGLSYETLVYADQWPIGFYVDCRDGEDNPTYMLQPNSTIEERFNDQQELLAKAKDRLIELGHIMTFKQHAINIASSSSEGQLCDLFEYYVDEWHDSSSNLDIFEYLGLSWDEYMAIVKKPSKVIEYVKVWEED